MMMRWRWVQCRTYKVYSWSVSSRVNSFFVWLEASFCPFTLWGVFGTTRITVLQWVTKKSVRFGQCFATAALTAGGLYEAMCSSWLLANEFAAEMYWLKIKISCVLMELGGMQWGQNPLLWGTAVHLTCLMSSFRLDQITCGGLENWNHIYSHKNSG